MKYLLLLLACLLTTQTAIAADKTNRSSTSKKSITAWRPAAFDETVDRLPPDYKGIDPKQFYKMLKKKVVKLEKREFETSEEFTQRIANIDTLLAPINTSDLYAFRNDSIYFEYNADDQAYIIGGPYDNSCHETSDYGKDKGWITCHPISISNEKTRYRAINAFGTSVVIERERGEDFALAFPKNTLPSDLYKKEFSKYHYEDKLYIPVEKARNLKNKKLAVLFVGRVTDAKIISGENDLKTASIDSPNERFISEEAVPFKLRMIIYYVVKTGEILHKKSF